MQNDVNENEVVESKPKKKRRLKKFLKISGISFGLLVFAAIVFYLVCLFVVAGEIRENICAWRDDPENSLNHRINTEPIEYKVDPEIAKDLEKFYIGKFEVLLPKDGLKGCVLSMSWEDVNSTIRDCSISPCYAGFACNFGMITEYYLQYRRSCRETYQWVNHFVWDDECKEYYSDSPCLWIVYQATALYCDEQLPVTMEEFDEIFSSVPADIEKCYTPWSVYNLETRLLMRKMLSFNNQFKVRKVKGANWRGYNVWNDRYSMVDMEIDGKPCHVNMYAMDAWMDRQCDDEEYEADEMGLMISDSMKHSILASMNIHAESNAGAIMYGKAREILDRTDIKLQEKLLGRFYALCAVSQEPDNLAYAQTYLSTFSVPSEQANNAYDKIADLFPDNEAIRKKATEIEEWYWDNHSYFQREGDDPEIEYPVVNEGAKKAGVSYSYWKDMTPEEKKQVAEAIKNGKTYRQWRREQRIRKRRESRDKSEE